MDDIALDEVIRDGIVRTFDQDKTVLEAQQRALGPDPDSVTFPVSIRVDAGPIQGRKLLASMVAREALAGASNVERMKASS
jgi:phenylpropionate dioxygenase-like ring-hydroxylating dioxygenase large terminal subunit